MDQSKAEERENAGRRCFWWMTKTNSAKRCPSSSRYGGSPYWTSATAKTPSRLVRHENPEVVVLDQKMPRMDGVQTLKEIKKIRPEVQVIMLTGHGSTEAARVSGKHDVSYYLDKPCGIDELIGVIQAAAAGPHPCACPARDTRYQDEPVSFNG